MPTDPLDYAVPSPKRVRDDIAYIAPMAIFLAFTQIAAWWPSTFPLSYVAKTVGAAAALVILWPHFTKIRWNFWWLGILFGVIGVVQWVGTEKLLLHQFPNYPRPHVAAFDPFKEIHSSAARVAFIAIRWAGASLVVPVMEELFWRDFAWRTILAPNDFKLAAVGEFDLKAWILVSLIFSAVHIQWITAIVWGLMIGGLLILTQSLGACIIMHGVTNFLLGLYVLHTKDWTFW